MDLRNQEIKLLKPDISVAQGKWANVAVGERGAFYFNCTRPYRMHLLRAMIKEWHNDLVRQGAHP